MSKKATHRANVGSVGPPRPAASAGSAAPCSVTANQSPPPSAPKPDPINLPSAPSPSATEGRRYERPAHTAEQSPTLPAAVLKTERRLSWLWILPLTALIAAGWIVYHAWRTSGVVVTVQLDGGHGLEPGDEVRYRGIAVGTIRDVDLGDDAQSVVVTALLRSEAASLATTGARFWVVRPQIGVTGVAGLDTVVGPRYLAALPGSGATQRNFVGLSDPPIVESIEAGDLEIILQSARRTGIRAGSPVLYRQVEIGRILSVGLTSDAGAVEARLHINRAYAQLVRPETRFWSVGGVDARVGLSGMNLQIESLESLIAGGVALATPPSHGAVVRNGHRFTLETAPQEEWQKWQPLVAIGSSFLPAGAPQPAPLRAALGWKEGGFLKSEKSARGWVLQTDEGLLGPANLLKVKDDVDRKTVVLEVAGQPLPLTADPAWSDGALARLDASVSGPRWAMFRVRAVESPEDCLAIGDAAAAAIPLAAAKLTPEGRSWKIDPAISLDESWHGACVMARSDGKLVGMVLVEKNAARVALLPAE